LWKEDNLDAGYIHRLAIVRKPGCKDLGNQILLKAEDLINAQNKKIRLDCIQENKRLNKYYLDNGYKLIKQCVYFDDKIGNLYEKIKTKAL